MGNGKGKGKGPVLDIALLHDEHVLRSALQSRKWQLIGMSHGSWVSSWLVTTF